MKKLFTLIALAAMAFAAQADVLTVADGTGEAQYAPFYGFQMDAIGSISQVIYPADMLADMNGGTITEVKFYPTQAFGALGSGNLQISLKEGIHIRERSLFLRKFLRHIPSPMILHGHIEKGRSKILIHQILCRQHRNFYLLQLPAYSSCLHVRICIHFKITHGSLLFCFIISVLMTGPAIMTG